MSSRLSRLNKVGGPTPAEAKDRTCSQCGKTFDTTFQLKAHVMIHALQNPLYVCELCGKEFNKLSSKNSHVLSHDYQFPCRICFQRFPSEKGFHNHCRKNHRTEFPYQCDVCSFTYETRKELVEHKLSVHDEGDDDALEAEKEVVPQATEEPRDTPEGPPDTTEQPADAPEQLPGNPERPADAPEQLPDAPDVPPEPSPGATPEISLETESEPSKRDDVGNKDGDACVVVKSEEQIVKEVGTMTILRECDDIDATDVDVKEEYEEDVVDDDDDDDFEKEEVKFEEALIAQRSELVQVNTVDDGDPHGVNEQGNLDNDFPAPSQIVKSEAIKKQAKKRGRKPKSKNKPEETETIPERVGLKLGLRPTPKKKKRGGNGDIDEGDGEVLKKETGRITRARRLKYCIEDGDDAPIKEKEKRKGRSRENEMKDQVVKNEAEERGRKKKGKRKGQERENDDEEEIVNREKPKRMVEETDEEDEPIRAKLRRKFYRRKEQDASEEEEVQKEGKFHCDICNMYFSQAKNVRRHMDEQHGISRPSGKPKTAMWTCDVCKRSLTREDTLRGHMLRVHGIEPPPKSPKRKESVDLMDENKPRHMCSYCSKLFHSMSNLKLHERTHTGERPYECGYCKKTFARKLSYTNHVIKHEGSAKCTVCGAAFGGSFALECHMQGHNKSHMCEICGLKCSTKYYLKYHMESHNPDAMSQRKKFKCPSCDFAATCQSKLDQHVIKHTGERAFKCQTCGKSFYRLFRLQEHILVHKLGKPHVCEICGTGYQSQATFRSHVLKNHPNNADVIIARWKVNLRQKKKELDLTNDAAGNVTYVHVEEEKQIVNVAVKDSVNIAVKDTAKLTVKDTVNLAVKDTVKVAPVGVKKKRKYQRRRKQDTVNITTVHIDDEDYGVRESVPGNGIKNTMGEGIPLESSAVYTMREGVPLQTTQYLSPITGGREVPLEVYVINAEGKVVPDESGVDQRTNFYIEETVTTDYGNTGLEGVQHVDRSINANIPTMVELVQPENHFQPGELYYAMQPIPHTTQGNFATGNNNVVTAGNSVTGSSMGPGHSNATYHQHERGVTYT